MPSTRLEINYKGDNNEVVIISVYGYIDSTTSPELSKVIDQQITQEKYHLIVNLKEVDFISSIGWGVFISNLKELRAHQGDLVLTNMSTNVHNIFDLMELSSIVKSFGEVNKAVVHFLGVEQQAVPKKKAAGATTASAVTTRTERVQPRQQAPKAAPTKPAAKPIRTAANRPAPIKLVSENTTSSYNGEVLYTQDHLLEKHIVRVILERPYYSIRQIAKALKLSKYGSVKKSRRKIKRELVKLGLENSEDRYEFALKNRS
jgi:anti-anti-sigma factor